MSSVLIILALILLWLIAKSLIRIFEQYKCPDNDVLLDYYKGRFTKKEDERRKVIAHLSVCEKCQNKLIEFSKMKDTPISGS